MNESQMTGPPADEAIPANDAQTAESAGGEGTPPGVAQSQKSPTPEEVSSLTQWCRSVADNLRMFDCDTNALESGHPQKWQDQACSALNEVLRMMPMIKEDSLRDELRAAVNPLVAALAQNRVPLLLDQALREAKDKLRQFGPTVPELLQYQNPQAPTQEEIATLARQEAQIWAGILLGLYRVRLARATRKVVELIAWLSRANYNAASSRNSATALRQAEVEASRARQDLEAALEEQAAATEELRIALHLQPDKPDSIPSPWLGGDLWAPSALLSSLAHRAFAQARNERDELLAQKRTQLEQSGQQPRQA